MNNLIERNGIFIPRPEVELFILLIRAHLKLDIDALPAQIDVPVFPDHIHDEFKALMNQCSADDVVRVITQSGVPVDVKRIPTVLDAIRENQLSAEGLREFCNHLMVDGLKCYERISDDDEVQRLKNELEAQYKEKRKKGLTKRGVSIALIGADGAGKSTLTRDIFEWLSWKIHVEYVYLGIPKSWEPVKALHGKIKAYSKTRNKHKNGLLRMCYNMYIHWLTIKRWTVIAQYRYEHHLLMKGAADENAIGLSDRYPLKEFQDMTEPMDGPRIRKLLKGRFSFLANKEEHYYSMIGLPDRLFVIQVPFDVLNERKPCKDDIKQREKVDAVNALSEGPEIVIIDGAKPYADVLCEIKREIWEMLK